MSFHPDQLKKIVAGRSFLIIMNEEYLEVEEQIRNGSMLMTNSLLAHQPKAFGNILYCYLCQHITQGLRLLPKPDANLVLLFAL